MKHSHWKLNTSNKGKLEEFRRFFAKYGQTLQASEEDLEEIDADPVRVIAHKASQLGENILVEDTALEIEGASIGVNIRWLLDHLPRYIGRKAQWIVLLAYRKGDSVFIHKGTLFGTIVEPKGSGGFGFDPVFLPEGAEETLAQSKPDAFNARAKAVEALIKEEPWAVHPCIKAWQGPWQRNHAD